MLSARGMPTVPYLAASSTSGSRSKSSFSLYAKRLGTSLAGFLMPAPRSQRLPVMKRRCLPVFSSMPKSLMVSRQLFSQRPQRTAVCLISSSSICSGRSSVDFAPVARSRASSAAPQAPMLPAMSGRMASCSLRFSNARKTASLRKVPPWTTACSPSSEASRSLMTLNSAFLMTEYDRPAEMSAGVAPSFCACLTREFMKTVQRLPRSTGASALRASAAKSSMDMLSEVANASMNEPQPAEHASLSMMCSMMPSLTCMHFMSWPPMSRMKSTSGHSANAQPSRSRRSRLG